MKCQCIRSSDSNPNVACLRCSVVRLDRNFDAADAIDVADRSAASIEAAAIAAINPRTSHVRANVKIFMVVSCCCRDSILTRTRTGRNIIDSAMVTRILKAGLVAVLALTTAARAQSPDPPALDDVLDKVTEYVEVYTRDFVGVVSEETYRQEVRPRSSGNDLRGFPLEGQRQTRTLKSDVLLVRAPAGDRWLQFRDVFEVDGKPVRDREERLAKLFLTPSPSAQQQVEDIKSASARYNIGSVNRNINIPVLALSVFDVANRPWFAFAIGKQKPQTLELEYREQRSDTLIRGRGEQGTPATGKFIVDRASGRILSSELHADTETLKAEIDVVYDAEAAVGGIFVPREMREKYESKDGSTITGRATYAKFRRYQVTVNETLKK